SRASPGQSRLEGASDRLYRCFRLSLLLYLCRPRSHRGDAVAEPESPHLPSSARSHRCGSSVFSAVAGSDRLPASASRGSTGTKSQSLHLATIRNACDKVFGCPDRTAAGLEVSWPSRKRRG